MAEMHTFPARLDGNNLEMLDAKASDFSLMAGTYWEIGVPRHLAIAKVLAHNLYGFISQEWRGRRVGTIVLSAQAMDYDFSALAILNPHYGGVDASEQPQFIQTLASDANEALRILRSPYRLSGEIPIKSGDASPSQQTLQG